MTPRELTRIITKELRHQENQKSNEEISVWLESLLTEAIKEANAPSIRYGWKQGYRDGLLEAAKIAEDLECDPYTGVPFTQIADAIRRRAKELK